MVAFGLLIALVLQTTLNSPLTGMGMQAGEQSDPSGITAPGPRLELSTQERIVVSLVPPDAEALLDWTQSPVGGENTNLGEVTASSAAGTPRLPVYRSLVGIPGDAEYELVVSAAPRVALDGRYDIPAVAQPVPIQEEDVLQSRWAALPDAAVYQSAQPYPEAPVKIVSDSWFRNQRVVMVEFYPLQYAPAVGEVYWYPSLRADIRLKTKAPGPSAHLNTPAAGASGAADLYDGTLSRLLINYTTAQNWQGMPQEAPLVNNFPIADGQPGLKIVVDHNGIYRVTYEDLVAAGMDVSQVDPEYLHLINIQSEIAYEFDGNDNHQFDAGESLLFYGEELPSQRLEMIYQQIMAPWISQCPTVCKISELIENYTEENVYWLYVGQTPGLRMQSVSGAPVNSYSVPEYFSDTQYGEEDLIWSPNHFTSSDVWFWTRARFSSGTLAYTMPITLGVIAPTGTPAVVRGELFSHNNINHRTLFSLNSNLILDSSWAGKKRYVFEQSVSPAILQNGRNDLRWETRIVSSAEFILFDRYQVTYDRQFVAGQDRLSFNYLAPGLWQYQVKGLASDDAVALDITDPLQPKKITGVNITNDGGGFKAAFELTQSAPVRIIVAGAAAGVESPKSLRWYIPPELEPAGGADYIFITHHDFITATQALADYRASQGLRTVVVDVADVYDQFNYGIYHPMAIRNYLERAMLTWPGKAPSYVLLVGGGSFEIRQRENLYVDEPNYIPPVLGIIDPWQGEIDGTSLLAAVIGTDIVPDLAIGRLPVNSAADVNAVVAKTIAYEGSAKILWQRNIVYIADKTASAGNFEASSDKLAAAYTPPGYTASKIYVSQYGPAITNAIIAKLNTDGALLVNYTGHGAIPNWASGPTVFSRDNVSVLNNGAMLPVVLSWTCLDGYFYYPYAPALSIQQTPSLVENFLLTGGKGAVATFSPTGLGVATGHDFLAEGFYNSIFVDGNWDLGAASLAAKANLYRAGGFYDLIMTYSVFGDPALRLRSPYSLAASPESGVGAQTSGYTLTYPMTVTNTGPVEDSFLPNVSGNAWVVNVPASVGPVEAGGQTTFDVQVQVPDGVSPGAIDQVVVQVKSKGDRSQVDQATFTTTANVYGAALQPTAVQRVVLPGTLVTHTVQITNTGNLPDAFDLSLSASTWATSVAPLTTGQLAPGQSMTALVTIQVPANAADYAAEALQLAAISQADPRKAPAATFLTTVRLYGVQVSPVKNSKAGPVGTRVAYSLAVENTGGFPESYALLAMGNTWTTTLPAAVGPLIVGETAWITASVDIPPDLVGGSIDDAVVRVVPQHDPTRAGQATLRTIGDVYGVLVRPALGEQIALPGTVVTYTLEITNTSSTTDTLDLTVGPHAWTTAVISTTGPLSPGEMFVFPMSVSVPEGTADFATDQVVITVTSTVVPERMAKSKLVTTARHYGVSTLISAAELEGQVGATVTYTLQVANPGGFVDSYSIQVSGNQWPALVNPRTTGTLDPLASTWVEIVVSIPPGAPGGSVDQALVTVRSVHDPSKKADIWISTRAAYFYLYLPLIKRH